MVPPLSGSVSASLRSAFLLPFSSSSAAAAGARVPTNSSSSPPPPPPLRPAAGSFTNQNTNTQVPAPEPLPPPSTDPAATSLHAASYAPSSLPSSPGHPHRRPFRSLSAGTWGRGRAGRLSRDTSEPPERDRRSLSASASASATRARVPALASAIVIWAGIAGLRSRRQGREAPTLSCFGGRPKAFVFVALSRCRAAR